MSSGDRFTTREKNKSTLLKNKEFLFHSFSFPHLNTFKSQIFYSLMLNGNRSLHCILLNMELYQNNYLKYIAFGFPPTFPLNFSSLYSAGSIDSISTDSKRFVAVYPLFPRN